LVLPLYEIDKQRAHKKLDEIYSNLFSEIDRNHLTFRDISEKVFNKKNDLASLVLRGALNYELSQIDESINEKCALCKTKLTRHRQKSSVLQSINGVVLFKRNYFYCRKCKIGFCPSDKELQIIPRRLQFDIQWKILDFCVRLPFEEARNEISKHYNIQVQKKTLHELIQSISDGLTITDTMKKPAAVREMLCRLRNGSNRRIVVVIGVDGAHVPIRPDHKTSKGKRGKGYWKEAKGIRIYAIADKRINHILSWHQIQDADQLKDCLDAVVRLNYIPADIARVCVCADGADWIWNRVKKVFPKAVMVLDYYHCSEHLHKFAEIFFDNDIEKIKWLKKAKEDLFSGNVLRLVGHLRRINTQEKELAYEISLLADYLEDRAEMTYYSSFKKGGYPIGSGGIESSNKYLCHRRMKISGAWWKEKMANAMLALRSSYVNETLSDVFNRYIKKQLKHHFSYN